MGAWNMWGAMTTKRPFTMHYLCLWSCNIIMKINIIPFRCIRWFTPTFCMGLWRLASLFWASHYGQTLTKNNRQNIQQNRITADRLISPKEIWFRINSESWENWKKGTRPTADPWSNPVNGSAVYTIWWIKRNGVIGFSRLTILMWRDKCMETWGTPVREGCDKNIKRKFTGVISRDGVTGIMSPV